MHELRVAENIVTSVLAEMERRGLSKVQAVGLRIGELTDIVPASLEFGFNVCVSETPLEGAELNIEILPVKGQCRQCKCEFEVEDLQFICPACGGRSIKTVQGQELDICYLEVDETKSVEEKAATWPK